LTHGRENYRRNTYLIAYQFYKNVIYVWPIWFFGFYSYFSGYVFYDPLLYQAYNVLYTQLPMTWFAIFDWEHKKEVLMANPKLYKIGLEDVYFNGWVFWRWWFYALWQGTVLMTLVFYTLGVGE
jgi:magnesium-transporting ATPase (P-type)